MKKRLTVYLTVILALLGMTGTAGAEARPSEDKGIVALAESLGMHAVPVETTAAETWYLIFTHSGSTLQYCLDAKLQTIGNGGTVQLWSCNAGNQQQWAIYNGQYLKNRASPTGRTLVLDAKLQTIGNGGTVQLWDYNGGAQQRWIPFSQYYLKNGASPAGRTLVLDAKAQEIRDGGKIQLWDYNGGSQQRWSIVDW
ncbi:hypothetical protein Msi02_84120 [Microbispora siamensis]|uniref:Ricin B lectin domain-containing protein n=1 Tax=Microbispora siamensis TaxID=564413 RepID=A0ABQ4H1N4_9ACTN|nr:hypothetical protein Msi02_84120 [Microbispora siamensis]